MIVGIEGIIEKKESTFLHINTNGIIHEVFVSINCSSSISENKVKLYISQIIREDTNTLYGFLNKNEKKLFDTVIKINGVGPKVALAICSTFTPSSFAQIVSNNDVDTLKRVPGIGPKGASRILVELSGFVVDNSNNEEDANLNISDAILALESLGFKKEIINKTLKTCTSNSTQELVKEALKKLSR